MLACASDPCPAFDWVKIRVSDGRSSFFHLDAFFLQSTLLKQKTKTNKNKQTNKKNPTLCLLSGFRLAIHLIRM